MAAAGQQRIVSVLVTDLVDSTSIAEKLGPERSKFLFDDVVRLMAEQVRRFDGTVAQLTGDGLLALFGAPTSHGDDAERAIRAALAVHEALEAYAADVAPAYGIKLTSRAAVNTGLVVVPALDVAPDVLYNALGDTVNVAARLQPSAGPGGVVVGPATAREVVGRFELDPLGELELKGRSESVAAFRVVREAEAEVASESPLVGRQPELGALVEALTRLDDGLGSIVSVTGEAGIGKSRLVAEARARIGGDLRVLVGNATSYTTQAPFWPVRDLLRGWLGLGVGEPQGRLRLELKASLAATLNGSADAVYPFLASLVGLPLEGADEERLRDLSRDSVQRQSFEAVATLFEAFAREKPLCVVLEDLHWADEPTLELVETLFELADREAVALVLLYRSEREHRSWRLGELARQRFPHRFVELELRPLAVEDAEQLAVAAAGADLPPEVSELLAARSGGNPFFLEEALRDLVERGVLVRADHGWALGVTADELTVPLLVQEALQARLDRLDSATREVVNVASVIGRTFGRPLLERMTDPEQLASALSALQRLDLVVEERRRPTPEYRFRHGLVQEVAYSSLTETRRRELHRTAGEALEALHSESLAEVYEPLARHFGLAGSAEKAVEYSLAAGDAAWALYADQAALEHYRRALSSMAADDPRARQLRFKVAIACHVDFDFSGADAAWAATGPETLQLARPAERTARLTTTYLGIPQFLPGHAYEIAGYWLTAQLFSGLLRVEPGLNIVYDTAADLRVSTDGREYVARIRPDAVWSDGEPLTAGDFVYGWNEMRRRRLPTAHLLDDVAEASAVEERTLRIRLHRPQPHFPYLLALPPTSPWPHHLFEGRAEDDSLDYLKPACNGPFELAEHDELHALFVGNDRWRGDHGNVGEILVRFLSWEASHSAWVDEELDLTMFFPRTAFGSAVVDRMPGLSTLFLCFVTDRPPFDDIHLRQAFARGVDRNRWSEIRGNIEPATSGGLLPPAMPGHSHRIGLEYDLGLARRLLAEAGHSDGRGLPVITIATPTPEWAQPVADQWREAFGVRVTIVTFPIDGDPREADPDVACWIHGWTADYPDPAGFFTALLKSRSGPPTAVYRDDEILGLLEQATEARNRDRRLRLMQHVERLLLSEHVAIVPLGYWSQTCLRQPWVHGFWTTPLIAGRLSDVVVER